MEARNIKFKKKRKLLATLFHRIGSMAHFLSPLSPWSNLVILTSSYSIQFITIAVNRKTKEQIE